MLFSAKTDKGSVRDVNQDGYSVLEFDADTAFFLVCDGMGGAVGGELASCIAREAAEKSISEDLDVLLADASLDRDKYMPKILEYAVSNANLAVYDTATEHPEYTGMGTTFVGAVVTGGRLYAVNVGDSRLYRISGGQIIQVTKDHSYVQFLVDMGVLTEDEAKKSPKKNIITRAVGTKDCTEADIFTETLENGDHILLCSDGLSNMLGRDELLDIISDDGDLDSKIDKMIARANERGGPDNITAILVSVGDGGNGGN